MQTTQSLTTTHLSHLLLLFTTGWSCQEGREAIPKAQEGEEGEL